MPDLEALWRDPNHWSLVGYHCPEDPRAIVPKRNIGMGWTMNWSNPRAIPLLVLLVAVPVLPVLGVISLGTLGVIGPMASMVGALIAVPLTIWMIVGICRRESRLR